MQCEQAHQKCDHNDRFKQAGIPQLHHDIFTRTSSITPALGQLWQMAQRLWQAAPTDLRSNGQYCLPSGMDTASREISKCTNFFIQMFDWTSSRHVYANFFPMGPVKGWSPANMLHSCSMWRLRRSSTKVSEPTYVRGDMWQNPWVEIKKQWVQRCSQR